MLLALASRCLLVTRQRAEPTNEQPQRFGPRLGAPLQAFLVAPAAAAFRVTLPTLKQVERVHIHLLCT